MEKKIQNKLENSGGGGGIILGMSFLLLALQK